MATRHVLQESTIFLACWPFHGRVSGLAELVKLWAELGDKKPDLSVYGQSVENGRQ